MRIHALVDSGNTLTEPISGAPVSVLDARIFYRLWPEGLSGFRVIPYHSVGKKSGILKGYPVPQMTLIQQGVEREYRNVYLAVSEEEIAEKRSRCCYLLRCCRRRTKHGGRRKNKRAGRSGKAQCGR